MRFSFKWFRPSAPAPRSPLAASPSPAALRTRSRIVNGLAIFAIWALSVAIVLTAGSYPHPIPAIGPHAPATLVAEISFQAENLSQTDVDRQKAANESPRCYHFLSAEAHQSLVFLDSLSPPPPPADEAVPPASPAAFLRENPAVAPLFSPEHPDYADAVRLAASNVLFTWAILPPPVPKASVMVFRGENAISVAANRIHPLDKARAHFVDLVRDALLPLGADLPPADLAPLAERVIGVNLDFDGQATRAAAERAARDVKPSLISIPAGTTLMSRGSEVSRQTVANVTAYNQALHAAESPEARNLRRIADSILLLVVLIVCIGWLRASSPGAYAHTNRRWLLVILALLSLLLSALFHYLAFIVPAFPHWIAAFALPMALPPILAALLLDPAAALGTGLWMALSSSLIFNREFQFVLLGLAAAVVSAVCLRTRVNRRAIVYRTGLHVGIVSSLMAFSLAAVNPGSLDTALWQIVAAFASGILSAFAATALLPLFELLFGITSDLSLLELSAPGHPLLQRLAKEAPGTYHHSLMVASIAAAAAEAIDADPLLVTVCAYFHDIGKLAKPRYFTENQGVGDNPHDELAPSMSVMLIKSHPAEGVALAKQYRLPAVIREAILSHHGTTLVSYFYTSAVRDLEAKNLPVPPSLESDFRYPGPRPQSRENAILLLADSVEAASRSLVKPSQPHIKEMVERILREKFLDRQLDLSPLTHRDLTAIADSFTFSLTNSLHTRTPYPAPTADR